jgi:hypothetical protein
MEMIYVPNMNQTLLIKNLYPPYAPTVDPDLPRSLQSQVLLGEREQAL